MEEKRMWAVVLNGKTVWTDEKWTGAITRLSIVAYDIFNEGPKNVEDEYGVSIGVDEEVELLVTPILVEV